MRHPNNDSLKNFVHYQIRILKCDFEMHLAIQFSKNFYERDPFNVVCIIHRIKFTKIHLKETK